MPPSSNTIWKPRMIFRGKGKAKFGGMRLSDEATEFQAWFLQQAARNVEFFSNIPSQKPKALDIWVHLSGKGKDRLKNLTDGRYKKLDVSNRVKFLEDTIAKAFGYDDGEHLDVFAHKREDPNDPRVDVFVLFDTSNVIQSITPVADWLGGSMRESKPPVSSGTKVVLCDRRSAKKAHHISRTVCLEGPYKACKSCPLRSFVLTFRV